jgi:hypothetical protein
LALKNGSQISYLDIASFVRSKYLSWALHSNLNINGIEKVRKIYEKSVKKISVLLLINFKFKLIFSLRNVPPFDVSFYLRYIEMEKCTPKIDTNRIINSYEDALKHFGKQDIGIFLLFLDQ